jgi:TolB protein
MYRIVSTLVVLSLIVIGFGCPAAAAPEGADPLDVSHLEGRLAFPVFENDTYNIYVSNIDGSDRELLIGEASQPDFNSDGSQIAYRSWKTDQRGLFSTAVDEVIPWNIQGKSVAESGRPVWSPDDKVILFQSYEEPDRKPRMYFTGGEGYLPIRSDKSGKFVDLIGIDPDWLPDGSIVYTEKECQNCGIFITSLTGGLIAQPTDSTADEAPAASPDGKRIAFMSTRDGVWDLYVVNVDGTGLTRLTEDPDIDGLPVWAPDGETLIFASNRDDEWGIWAIDVESKAMAKLFSLGGELDGKIHEGTSRGWTEERISWSPTPPPPPEPAPTPSADLDTSYLEGRIAFPVFEDGTYNIYTSNMDGSDRQLLVSEASQPAFNSDGSQIAYRSWKTDQRGMFSTPVDEMIPWNIQGKVVIESARPNWSSDDKVILFHSYEETDRKPRIYHTAGDSYKTILTDKSGKNIDLFGIDPDWLTDDSIVYAEKECEKCGIFSISLSGGLIGQLTDHPADEAPVVSPDGKRVAFMSTRDGVWDLYVVNVDGTGLARLTADPDIDGLPIWAPDGETLIFVSNRDDEWGIWALNIEDFAIGKLFSLGGELDGVVHPDSSRGWTEETISWIP